MKCRSEIFLIPQNGLCNRMRVLDSVIQTNRGAKRLITLAWNLGSGMNCRLEHLFKHIPGIEKIWHWSSFSRIDRARILAKKISIQTRDGLIIDENNSRTSLDQREKFSKLSSTDSAFIRTSDRLCTTRHPYEDWIPSKEVTALVDIATRGLLELHTIGVHIRRQDHRIAINNSPTAAFIRTIEQEIERDASTQFFIASDDPDELVLLRKRFGNRIHWHPKRSFDRAMPVAAEDALVDLLSLASTDKIIGSHESSFSYTAAEIGGIPIEIANLSHLGIQHSPNRLAL